MDRKEALRYLNAYVDDELDVREALEVQAWIENDPECRVAYERLRALKRVLHEKLEAEGPSAPEMLRKRVEKALRRERRGGFFKVSLAAAAAVSALFLGWGVYQRAMRVPHALVAETMSLYRIEAGNPLDYESSDVRKISSWLTKTFQEEMRPIEVKPGRGKIMGVRLCRFAGGKGVVVRYRTARGKIALFIRESRKIPYSFPMVPSFRIGDQEYFAAQWEGFYLVYWKKGMWLYALVGQGESMRKGPKEFLRSDVIY